MPRPVLLVILILLVVGAGAAAFFIIGPGIGTPPTNTTPQPTLPAEIDDDGDTPEITPQIIIPTEIPLTEVVVALQNIPRGNRIDPSMVGVIPFPIESVALGAFDDIELVIGKIARTDIFREQHILSNMVVDDLTGLGTGTGSDIAAVLPQNLVAVAVPVDRITSVGYALQPGDRVDVIVSMLFVDVDPDFQTISPNFEFFIHRPFEITIGEETIINNLGIDIQGPPGRGEIESTTFQENLVQLGEVVLPAPPGGLYNYYRTPAEEQRPRLASQITVRNALVMWIGDFPLDGRIFRPAPTPTDVGAANLPPTETPTPNFAPPTSTPVGGEVTPTEALPDLVTLAVTPQDAIVLTYFIEARLPITFALRSASTVTLQETEPVTLRFILERYNIRVPDKLNFAVEPAIRSIRELSAGNRIELQSAVTPTPLPEDGEEPPEEGNSDESGGSGG